MLYIIYCKPDKEQGKKEFINVLEDNFGVVPIKKFTSKSIENENKVDRNLIYLSDGSKISTQEEFLSAINMAVTSENSDTANTAQQKIYVYERVKDGKICFYGIKQEDIFKAMQSEKNYVLVCTNIDTIIEIKKDAKYAKVLRNKKNSSNMYVYCLVRKNNSSRDERPENHLTIRELKELYAGNTDKDVPGWLEALPDDTPAVLSYGEARELDFFRYISEFSNLLIIRDYGESFDSEYSSYVEDVCKIVEKYIGLTRIKESSILKVFVVHPMSEIKFKINDENGNQDKPLLSDEKSEVNRLFKKMICFCFGNKEVYNITFADELKDNRTRKEGSSELTKAILEEIDKSDIIVGDLRNANQNCIYEIGYACGKGKTVFLVWPVQQLNIIKGLIFDVSTYGGSAYDLNDLISLNNAKDLLIRLIQFFGAKIPNEETLYENHDLMAAFAHDKNLEEFKKIYEEAISH